MSYDYETEKPKIFTADGVAKMLRIRDAIDEMLAVSGAVLAGTLLRNFSGDSWFFLAVLDYLVEEGRIHEVTDKTKVAGQSRVFVAAR